MIHPAVIDPDTHRCIRCGNLELFADHDAGDHPSPTAVLDHRTESQEPSHLVCCMNENAAFCGLDMTGPGDLAPHGVELSGPTCATCDAVDQAHGDLCPVIKRLCPGNN